MAWIGTGATATSILSGLRKIAENDSDPSTSARVAAWRELAERVIGPVDRQRSQENHLHVNVTPERMRDVARRLASARIIRPRNRPGLPRLRGTMVEMSPPTRLNHSPYLSYKLEILPRLAKAATRRKLPLKKRPAFEG